MIKAIVVFGGDVEIPNDFGETPGLLAARSSKGEDGHTRNQHNISPCWLKLHLGEVKTHQA